jgi:hypothetical protein
MPDPIEIALPLTGGCQCGACRYRVTRAPLTLYVCHCTECQRQSSSGFGMSMPIPAKGLEITSGAPRLFQRPSASGRAVACAFCPDCGTRLYHQPARDDRLANMTAHRLGPHEGFVAGATAMGCARTTP